MSDVFFFSLAYFRKFRISMFGIEWQRHAPMIAEKWREEQGD